MAALRKIAAFSALAAVASPVLAADVPAAAPALAVAASNAEVQQGAQFCATGVAAGKFASSTLADLGYALSRTSDDNFGSARLGDKRVKLVWSNAAPATMCSVVFRRTATLSADQIAELIRAPLGASPATNEPSSKSADKVVLSTSCCTVSVMTAQSADGLSAAIWI